MWFQVDVKQYNFDNYLHFSDGEIDYYCNGIFFIPGFKAGIKSMEELAHIYKETGVLNFINFMGSFHFVIKNKDLLIFFTNNGIDRCFFFNDNIVSDNILDVVKRSEKFQFNESGVCQYLTYGKVFFNDTYINDISITNSNCFYTIRDGQICKHKKNIGTLSDANNGLSPEKFSKIISESLADTKKVISLTGGFDSRYVLSMLVGKCQIDAALSGSNEEHLDFIISKKVAETAGISYSPVFTDKPHATKDYLTKTFLERGGYINSLNDGVFRLNEYLKVKKDEGYECLLTGDTGIFHKSDEWPQYFPFYTSKIYSVKRDFRNIVLANKKNLPFSHKFKRTFNEDKRKILAYMRENKQEVNTQNCDWFSWYLSRPASYGPSYNSQDHIMCSYPPLLEYRLVVYSYNLRRRKRLLATAMKEYITSVDPNIAKIKTVSGATASSRKIYILPDLIASFLYIVKSAIRFFSRIFLKEPITTPSITDWSCEDEIRKSDFADEVVTFGKQQNWLCDDITKYSIPYDMLTRLMEIYLLGEYFKGNI